MKESEYFNSKEFKKGIKEQIKKDTWGNGFPMVYMNKKGQIVEHWENGEIKILKQNKK
jgi:hypothetical protein